jgi:hypothetical protein
MIFYPGLHQPSDAKHMQRAFISVNRLRTRRKPLGCLWIMDSGAFTEISMHGRYRESVVAYATEIERWARPGSGMVAAVAQDWMCEPFILERTGLTVTDHQRLTIERYDALRALVRDDVCIIPVLQGYTAGEYLQHLKAYGDRLGLGAYVGVGSVCKRNTRVLEIERILFAIQQERPDLRLHGFGLKATALGSAIVRDALFSADSMAWSFAARYEGRNRNDWREAARFAAKIEAMPVQTSLELGESL